MQNTTKRGKPIASNELLSPLDELRKRLNTILALHNELLNEVNSLVSWSKTLSPVEYTITACAAVVHNNISAPYVWSVPVSSILEPYKERSHSAFGNIPT